MIKALVLVGAAGSMVQAATFAVQTTYTTAAEISVEETRRVLNIGRHPVSLDRPIGESEDSSFGD